MHSGSPPPCFSCPRYFNKIFPHNSGDLVTNFPRVMVLLMMLNNNGDIDDDDDDDSSRYNGNINDNGGHFNNDDDDDNNDDDDSSRNNGNNDNCGHFNNDDDDDDNDDDEDDDSNINDTNNNASYLCLSIQSLHPTGFSFLQSLSNLATKLTLCLLLLWLLLLLCLTNFLLCTLSSKLPDSLHYFSHRPFLRFRRFVLISFAFLKLFQIVRFRCTESRDKMV